MERVDSKQFWQKEGVGESKYELSHIIGKGSYGTVCAAINRQTGQKVAIKHIDRVFADKADTVRIIRELRFLRVLKHPNIVSVTDVVLPSQRKTYDDIYIVFELLDTDLSKMIRSRTKYDETHRQWMLYQLLAGLRHVHAANVFHRDLKPGNVLLNADCDLKICDFGLARASFTDKKDCVFWTDYVATRWYRAPELICSYFTKYTTSIDIWSVGCIFAEVMRRRPLFPGHNVYHQLDLITDVIGTPSAEEIAKVRSQKARDYLRSLPTKPRKAFGPMFPGCDPEAISLLERMLTFDPEHRMTAQEAMHHPYFAKFAELTAERERMAEHVPELAAQEFAWESDKSLSRERLREILFEEMALYHPEGDSGGFESMAGQQVKEGFDALNRGDTLGKASSMSMPAAKTAGLFAQAQDAYNAAGADTMVAQDGTITPGADMDADLGHDDVGDDDDMIDEPVSITMLPAEYQSQTISAADMAKLAGSADQLRQIAEIQGQASVEMLLQKPK